MKQDNSHCLLLVGSLSGVVIIVGYRHPNFPRGAFLELLGKKITENNDKRLLVFGDMNFDLRSDSNRTILDFFKKYKLTPVLDITTATTEFGTHLDLCFGNISTARASVYETYYSYHKALSIEW